MPELHEPQTKGTNKTRELQDIMIRAMKAGCEDPLSAARFAHEWLMDASYEVQISVLQYAMTHMWSVVESKMKPQRYRKASASDRARIEADEKAILDRKWLDAIIPMTGAQVRAAKRLPDEMAAKINDDQRVGEVFTVAELQEVLHAERRR